MPVTSALVLAMSVLVTASAPLAQEQAAEAAIRAIVEAQVKAWNAGDGVAYASAVSPDVSFTNLFGMVIDIDNEVRNVKAMPAGIVVPADGIVRTQLMEVFVRRDGRWLIEAYHNVDLEPGARP